MLKLKLSIRWIVPLLLVAIVAAYFVLGPVFGAHAASVHQMAPDVLWNR